jgi:hypothetical protein
VSFTCEGETIDTLGVPPVEGWPVVAKVVFANGTLNFNGCDYANSPKEFNLTITETKTFDFKVTGPGGDITESVTIVVSQPVPPTQDEAYLCAGAWKKVKLEFQDGPGLPWVEATIGDCMKDDLIFFYLLPSRITVYDNGEIHCGIEENGQGSWYLRGSILTTNEKNNYSIITLTQDTLVWVYHPGGQQDANRETFVRQTKK